MNSTVAHTPIVLLLRPDSTVRLNEKSNADKKATVAENTREAFGVLPENKIRIITP